MPAACFRRSVDVDAGVSGGRTNVGTAGPLIDLNAWTGRPCHAVNIPRHSEAPVVTLNRVRAVSHGVACAAPATNLRTMWRMAPAHHRDASQLRRHRRTRIRLAERRGFAVRTTQRQRDDGVDLRLRGRHDLAASGGALASD